jgi:hypothetical protein
MSEMLQEEYSMPMGLGSAAAWGTCQDTPPAQQQQQQQQQQQLDPEDWYMRMINGLTVTEQLLLPGLLLQPVPNTQVCEPGPASCSSSAHHQGSSDAAVPGADTTTTSPTSSTTSSSSSIHKVFCPAPGVLPPAAAAVGGPVAVALDGGECRKLWAWMKHVPACGLLLLAVAPYSKHACSLWLWYRYWMHDHALSVILVLHTAGSQKPSLHSWLAVSHRSSSSAFSSE